MQIHPIPDDAKLPHALLPHALLPQSNCNKATSYTALSHTGILIHATPPHCHEIYATWSTEPTPDMDSSVVALVWLVR